MTRGNDFYPKQSTLLFFKTVKTVRHAGWVFLLMLFTFTACSIVTSEPTEEKIPDITPPKIAKKPEMTVTRGKIAITARGQGMVISEKEETLFFDFGDETEGTGTAMRVKKVNVAPGEQVEKGAVLAVLNTKDLDLEISKKREALKLEESTLISALRSVPQTEEERLKQEKTVKDFRDKQRELEVLERQMARATLKAPFAGLITQVSVKDGSEVKPYEPVMRLIDPSQLVIGVGLSQQDLTHIQIGMPASIEVGATQLTGKVMRLPATGEGTGGRGNTTDERDGFVWIKPDAPLPEGTNRGAFARATFELLAKEDVVKVPKSYLNTYGGRTYVIVKEGDTKREVDVELGLETATEVEIISGLKGGERIVGK
ncbi:MAG: efflux RND transporter periplasmic adaptor subunit [Candidatus Carbobacillus altaicus]|uniref:Putative Co/Zn/Cd efflux system membrane fusion protein n=1 Tax=Candidatus Carbonibacillus altaicus TaxID=2163959 RepID=A0A2R6Y4M0_9BACL|nr:efflux RND transporter periplasmic adaptor subunit [Candidatus Carbobacillus altaicus]PTQ57608.1 MAG: putative Co/Zn/Cd efflux system membrane fusion protein [Candidatus Carbobacillus altaicus]